MRQMSFADQPPYVHQETSVEAAEAIKPTAGSLRAAVYEKLLDAGSDGLTDQQLQRALRLDPSTERPRRIELVDAGLVRDSGHKRLTLSGRRAIVWVAA